MLRIGKLRMVTPQIFILLSAQCVSNGHTCLLSFTFLVRKSPPYQWQEYRLSI